MKEKQSCYPEAQLVYALPFSMKIELLKAQSLSCFSSPTFVCRIFQNFLESSPHGQMAPFLIKVEAFLSVPACTGACWLHVCGGLQGEAHHCSAWGFPGAVPASGSQEPPSRGGVAGVFPSSLPRPYFEAPIDFPLEIDLTFSPTPLLARFRLAFKKKKSRGDFHRFQKLSCCSGCRRQHSPDSRLCQLVPAAALHQNSGWLF